MSMHARALAHYSALAAQAEAERDATLCADCLIVLTQANTSVDPEARFWIGSTWEDETHCAACKANHEDCRSIYVDPDSDTYRLDMLQAGRGHLLR